MEIPKINGFKPTHTLANKKARRHLDLSVKIDKAFFMPQIFFKDKDEILFSIYGVFYRNM